MAPDSDTDPSARMKRVSVFLDAQAREDIETIKRCAGLSSVSAAIRSALRQQARQMRTTTTERSGR